MKRDLIILGVLLVIFLGGYFGLKYYDTQNQKKLTNAEQQVKDVENSVSEITNNKDNKIIL